MKLSAISLAVAAAFGGLSTGPAVNRSHSAPPSKPRMTSRNPQQRQLRNLRWSGKEAPSQEGEL